MRLAELSRRTGTPIATIKFYRREGLLQPGASTAQNKVEYGEAHVQRLRFARMLILVGRLSVSATRELLNAIDDGNLPRRDLLLALNRTLSTRLPVSAEVDVRSATAHVDGFLERLGWRVEADAPGRLTLAQSLASLWQLGWEGDFDALLPYAGVAAHLAALEDDAPSDSSAAVVARVVLFDVALDALRRLAQEHQVGSRAAGISEWRPAV